MGWGRQEHSAPDPAAIRTADPPCRDTVFGDVQRLGSRLKIKVKLILTLEEKDLKEMVFKEVASDEKHSEKKGFKEK